MAIMARPTGHRNVLINGVSLCLKAPGLSSYPTTAGYCHAVGPDRLCLHRCSAYPGPLQCVELRRDDGALSPGPLGALCGASTAWRRCIGGLAPPATAVAWQTTGTAVPRPPRSFAKISGPACTEMKIRSRPHAAGLMGCKETSKPRAR